MTAVELKRIDEKNKQNVKQIEMHHLQHTVDDNYYPNLVLEKEENQIQDNCLYNHGRLKLFDNWILLKTTSTHEKEFSISIFHQEVSKLLNL